MPEQAITDETILHDSKRLGLDDSFRFRCAPDLECFTACCRDVSVVLTPYDVLRLKKALGLDSSDFLEQYTICVPAPPRGLPVVFLKMDEATKCCPLVTREGCSIYPHRPWACRMYPLGVAEPRTATPEEKRFHFLIQEELCGGHRCDCRTTVRDWISGQGAEEYEMMAASFKTLTLHDFWKAGEPLAADQSGMVYMACYDLDRFRRFVFETRFLQLFEMDEARVDAIRADDVELLDLGMEWLRFVLFKEKAMKIRRPVMEARRRALEALAPAQG